MREDGGAETGARIESSLRKGGLPAGSRESGGIDGLGMG